MADPRATVPPHSLEAEQSVLGALLQDNRVMDRVAALLEPWPAGGMYQAEHRVIWAAVRALVQAAKPADVITVYDELQRTGRLDDAGGLVYLHQLATSVATPSGARGYAEIVARHARSRGAIAAAHDLIGAVREGGDPQECIDTAMQALLALQQGLGDSEPQPLVDLLGAWVDDLTARAEGRTDARSTGFPDIDARTGGGLWPGELTVIGARPSMGKTALCHTMARALCAAGPVLVLTMEDSLETMISRQVAALGRANLADLRAPRSGRADMWERVSEGVEQLRDLPIWADPQPCLNTGAIRRKALSVRARAGGLGCVFVDYLQLMEEGDDNESRAYELNRIARRLKMLAKDLRCPVVLLSQLSRKADEVTGPPRLDHLAESGGIEQAADNIWLLWRRGRVTKKPEDKHHAQVELAKQKNGPTDTIQLWFDGATQRMESVAIGEVDHA